jgi:hypothetical protein
LVQQLYFAHLVDRVARKSSLLPLPLEDKLAFKQGVADDVGLYLNPL